MIKLLTFTITSSLWALVLTSWPPSAHARELAYLRPICSEVAHVIGEEYDQGNINEKDARQVIESCIQWEDRLDRISPS